MDLTVHDIVVTTPQSYSLGLSPADLLITSGFGFTADYRIITVQRIFKFISPVCFSAILFLPPWSLSERRVYKTTFIIMANALNQ